MINLCFLFDLLKSKPKLNRKRERIILTVPVKVIYKRWLVLVSTFNRSMKNSLRSFTTWRIVTITVRWSSHLESSSSWHHPLVSIRFGSSSLHKASIFEWPWRAFKESYLLSSSIQLCLPFDLESLMILILGFSRV